MSRPLVFYLDLMITITHMRSYIIIRVFIYLFAYCRSQEINQRVQSRVVEFIDKDNYEFGDVSREVENRRRQWVEGLLGKEAAENYQLGDITKKSLAAFAGKDEYEFGDVTKKIMGDLFGKRKRGGSQDTQ